MSTRDFGEEQRLAYEVELLRRVRDRSGSNSDREYCIGLLRDQALVKATAVLTGWIKNGEIYAKVLAKNGRMVAIPAAQEVAVRIAIAKDPTAQDLALDAAIAAWPRFRDREILGGGFDPHLSRLDTYFVGAALLAYPNVWKSWLRGFEKRNIEISLSAPSLELFEFPASSQPVDEQGTYQSWLDHLAPQGSDEREAMIMRAEGHTIVSIATRLRTTPYHVNKMLDSVAGRVVSREGLND